MSSSTPRGLRVRDDVSLQHPQEPGDDNRSVPAAPTSPVHSDHDHETRRHCHESQSDGEEDNRKVDHLPPQRRISRIHPNPIEDEETAIPLNAADRSFLDTLRKEDDNSMDTDGDDNHLDEGDDEVLRYDRPMWQHVLDLANDPERADDGIDHSQLYEEGASDLMIGPLLPSGRNDVVPHCNSVDVGVGRLSERSTLAELPKLAHANHHTTPLSRDTLYLTNSNKNHSEDALYASRNVPAPAFPHVLIEGRTPPRKRKFDLIINSEGDVDSIMLDTFNSPSRRNRQNQLVTTTIDPLQAPPRPTISPRRDPQSFDDSGGLDLVGDGPQSNSTRIKESLVDNLKTVVARPKVQSRSEHSSKRSEYTHLPKSLARSRWDFVISEQAIVKRTMEKARADYERALSILKESQEQYQSVQDAVQVTCRDCFSFLIQEDKAWYQGYLALKAYHGKHGDSLVPRSARLLKSKSQGHVCESDNSPQLSKLSKWVGVQRKLYKNGKLEEYKVYALKQLDFDFDPVETRWMRQYQNLVDFVEKNGHAKVPYDSNSKTHGPTAENSPSNAETSQDGSLGAWVKRQQHQYKLFKEGKDTEMTKERINLLDAVGMIWNRRELPWTDRMKELREFKSSHNHINVPSTENAGLAEWVRKQRSRYAEYVKNPHQSSLSISEVQQLQEVGIVGVDKRETKWQSYIGELCEFRNVHGHCYVPEQYPKNPQLASWCKRQRQNYRHFVQSRNSPLTENRINQLKRIGFEFDVSPGRRRLLREATPSWDEFFAEVKSYCEEKGHHEISDTIALGKWWKLQREMLERHREGHHVSLSLDKLEKLTSLFDCQDHDKNLEKNWEDWFGELLAHRIHTNTYRMSNSSSRLKRWVEEQRREYEKYAKGMPSKLTFDRISKLQRAKFPFNLKARSGVAKKTKTSKSWEELYNELLQFRLKHESFDVPKHYAELFDWMNEQQQWYRQDHGQLDIESQGIIQERLGKLRRVGFPFKKGERGQSTCRSTNKLGNPS